MAVTVVSAAILLPFYALGGESGDDIGRAIKARSAPSRGDLIENVAHVSLNSLAIAGVAKLLGASWGTAAAIGGGTALAIDALFLANGYRK